jgi:hypothetical protein
MGAMTMDAATAPASNAGVRSEIAMFVDPFVVSAGG